MQDILIDSTDGVVTITLNRVEKKNSFTSAMYAACADALEQAKADAAVRVVVIQGHLTVFSAGNDIADFLNNPTPGLNGPVLRFLRELATFPKPLLAAVCGPAWAWAPPCCSTATWSMPATTRPSPCPL
jgi:enoyl-CoA hydratase/carnithine racemase